MSESESQREASGGQPDAATPQTDVASNSAAEKEQQEEEEETCGFCIFMKAGGCRQAFVAWSDCVDRERESGGDFTEECREKTFALRDCMLKNKDYYAPVLDVEDEAAQHEAAEEAGGGQAASKPDDQQPDASSQGIQS